MQLLTPLIRARIESMVLDAIARIPPNIRPTDSCFLEWLESLIRYHAQHPMEPAAEKPPVLGGIGVADQHHSYDGEDDLYIETGVIDPVSVGLLDPARLLPGIWKTGTGGDGAPNSGVYQGLYNSTEATYDAENESLAIGEGDPPLGYAGEAAFQKKLMVGYFPPSSFNGIMRHYMQSYYGADNELTNQFHLDTVGTQIVLKLPNTTVGFYSHSSVGILHVGADNNLDYRFIVIESPAGNGLYSVKECDIKFPFAEDARAEFEDAGTSAADREKVLTYLFGHSKIDDLNFREVDTFELDNHGSDLAYGWKFNNAGTKAAICLTEIRTSGGGYDFYYSSSVEVTFGTTVENLTIESAIEDGGLGWGPRSNIQIWRPNTDFTTCSRVYTLEGLDNPPGSWSDNVGVRIYCWYSADNVLQIVALSMSTNTFALHYEYTWSSNVWPTQTPVTDISHLLNGHVLEDEARYMHRINTSNGTTVAVDIGDTNYEFVSFFGDVLMYNVPASASGATNWLSSFGFISTTHSTYSPIPVPGWSDDVLAFNASNPTDVTRYNNNGYQEYTTLTGDHWAYAAVDLYVPLGDAEAIYVGRLDYLDPAPGATNKITYVNNTVLSQHVTNKIGGETVYSNVEFIVWQDPKPNWSPDGTTVEPTEEVYEELTVHVHSRTLDGVEGVYDGSPSTYFARPLDAESPAAKTFRESWGVAALRGSDLGTLDDGYSTEGVWTGWI